MWKEERLLPSFVLRLLRVLIIPALLFADYLLWQMTLMLLLVMMMVVVLMVKIQWFPVIWHERHTDSHFKKVLGITDLGFNCHLLTLWTWVNQGQITESQDSSKFCKTGRWTSRSRSSSNNLEICGVYFRDISKKNKITYSLSQSHNLHIQHITSKFPPKVYQGAPFVESYTKHSIIACPGAAFFFFFFKL